MLPPQKGSGEVADVEKKAELEKKGLGRTDDLLLLPLWPPQGRPGKRHRFEPANVESLDASLCGTQVKRAHLL